MKDNSLQNLDMNPSKLFESIVYSQLGDIGSQLLLEFVILCHVPALRMEKEQC